MPPWRTRRATSFAAAVWLLACGWLSTAAPEPSAEEREEKPADWTPSTAALFEAYHGPFGREGLQDRGRRRGADDVPISAPRRRLIDSAAQNTARASDLGRDVVSRRFLGHQSDNRGKGLGDRETLYQPNEYFDGKYPYLHTSVVGHSETSVLGGDWDMRYLEPYPSFRVLGNDDSSSARPASVELFEGQRGLNIVTMLDALFASLRDNYCTNMVGEIRTNMIRDCDAFLNVVYSTWRRIGDAVCGAVPWSSLEGISTAEKLERIFAECETSFQGDVESTVEGLIQEVLSERLITRPDVVPVLAWNDAVQRGNSPVPDTGWRLDGWGKGPYPNSQTPSQIAAWKQRRVQPSFHRPAKHTAMIEMLPGMRDVYMKDYRTHPSPFATKYHPFDAGKKLSWSTSELRWCTVVANARRGYRDNCLD